MEHKCRFWFPDPNHTNCNLLRIKAYLKLTLSHAAFWLAGFNIFTIIYSYQHTGADCHTRCSLCHTLCAFSFAFHHQPISAGLISDVCWHWFPLSPPPLITTFISLNKRGGRLLFCRAIFVGTGSARATFIVLTLIQAYLGL